MSQKERPKGPAAPGAEALSRVDVEPVPPPSAGLTLIMEQAEELTAEDLAARATVGFALDLEPMLPGPAVGSEVLLLQTDPAAARALGVRPDAAPAPPPAPAPSDAGAPPAPIAHDAAAPPPEPVPPSDPGVDVEPVLSPPAADAAAASHVDVEPVLTPPGDAPASSSPPASAPDVAPPPPSASPPSAVVSTASEFIPEGLSADLEPPPAPAPPLPPPPPPPAVLAPPTPSHSLDVRAAAAARRPPVRNDGSTRRYPLAFAWAQLGESPNFSPLNTPVRKTRAAPTDPGSGLMEDMLDLAAVGRDDKGVMEMHLVFKEEFLRGLICKLRFEPTGLHALFVAPDETVRRYVDGTATELVERMRRRGMKVGGWTVEVSR